MPPFFFPRAASSGRRVSGQSVERGGVLVDAPSVVEHDEGEDAPERLATPQLVGRRVDRDDGRVRRRDGHEGGDEKEEEHAQSDRHAARCGPVGRSPTIHVQTRCASRAERSGLCRHARTLSRYARSSKAPSAGAGADRPTQRRCAPGADRPSRATSRMPERPATGDRPLRHAPVVAASESRFSHARRWTTLPTRLRD